MIKVCPEVEIGLSVPRPPVQLMGKLGVLKMIGRDDPSIDITSNMENYCQHRPAQLNSIQGYIFKSKSPSCGINEIPVFNDQAEITALTKGVFVSAILQQYPNLPITDELNLLKTNQCNKFLDQVLQYKNKHAKKHY